MKAMVYTAPGELKILEVDRPTPARGEVVLRVSASGICGSELEGFATRSPRRVPPLIMGHEFGGVVVEVGEEVISVKVGDLVAVNPLLWCGQCDLCRQGRTNICRDRRLIGMHRPGAFAEYVAVPEKALHLLPFGFTPEMIAMVEPVANAVHALAIAQNPIPQTVVVFGAGTIGLFCAQVAKLCGGPRVMVVDINPYRLEVAKKLVANRVVNSQQEDLKDAAREVTNGEGFDLAIDAVGISETRAEALNLVRPGGTAVWIGLHSDATSLPGMEAVLYEKRVQGSYAYTNGDFRKAIQLVRDGCLRMEEWARSFPLEQGVEVFYALLRGEADYIKALLVP